MSYRVEFTGRARKELLKLPAQQQQFLLSWMNSHLSSCENPRLLKEARPLKGTKYGWRFKVGSYRILASVLDEELLILVVRAGHRQNKYAHLPKM